MRSVFSENLIPECDSIKVDAQTCNEGIPLAERQCRELELHVKVGGELIYQETQRETSSFDFVRLVFARLFTGLVYIYSFFVAYWTKGEGESWSSLRTDLDDIISSSGTDNRHLEQKQVEVAASHYSRPGQEAVNI